MKNLSSSICKILIVACLLVCSVGCSTKSDDKSGIDLSKLGYDEISEFSEGLACVRKGDKYGLINQSGTEILACEYDFVSDFFNTTSIVKKGDEWSEFLYNYGRTYFINSKLFEKDDDIILVRKNNKYGFMNKDGENILPFEYEDAGKFSEGLAYVKKDGRYGFVDKTGKEIIPFEYRGAKRFNEGIACVKKDNKWGFIDKTGKEIIPFNYEDAEIFSEGLACVKLNGKWGFINKKDEVVIDFQYEYGTEFDSRNRVKVLKDGVYTVIDKTGKVLETLN